MININLVNNKQAQITTDIGTLNLIREKFSIPNPAFRKNNRFAPARLYAISPLGKFDIGLLENIKAHLDSEQLFYKVDSNLENKFKNGFDDPIIKKYGMTYRDHQDKSIHAAIKKGRGVIIIPTAGGKTLIMAGIIESLRLNMNKPNAKALVIVPSLQLVTQTSKDFEEYGMNDVTKWSGDNVPDADAITIVAGTQILLSNKTDLSLLDDIDILLIDETHGLRRGNEINKVLGLIKTDYRFGFTGTMPPSLIDQWNIIGKIGPILYEEKTKDLELKKYVSSFKITILNVNHKNIPRFGANTIRPTEAYENELLYLMNDARRNEIICKLAIKLNNNTVIMVDRIDHGVELERKLTSLQIMQDPSLSKSTYNPPRPVFFIRGSTEVDEREKIRELMNERNDVIVIAVSKIFSTGINIPNLHNIIFASAGKAKIKIMQSIGRALRLHHTKTMANIFDISDNTKYGKTHLAERIKLYETEKYNYEKKEIQ
jgi:superfamily II DNA or RNA helicase